jgi:hypothetical protein
MNVFSSEFGELPGRSSRRMRKLSKRKLKKLFKKRLFALYRG